MCALQSDMKRLSLPCSLIIRKRGFVICTSIYRDDIEWSHREPSPTIRMPVSSNQRNFAATCNTSTIYGIQTFFRTDRLYFTPNRIPCVTLIICAVQSQDLTKYDVLTKTSNSNKALSQVILKIFKVLYTNAEPEKARVGTGV